MQGHAVCFLLSPAVHQKRRNNDDAIRHLTAYSVQKTSKSGEVRSLDDDQSVIFADDNWSLFEEILLAVDRDQKNYAKHMLDYLKEEAGSTDVSEILSNLLLANDRTANREDVDSNTWRFDFLDQGAGALGQIAKMIHGDYNFESEFYDTSRGTALVPFIGKLKEAPNEWALVQFDYHI